MKMPKACSKEFEKFLSGNVGRMIQAARLSMGLGQRELGELTGFSMADLGRIENGDLLPSVYQWTRIAKALSIPLDAFEYSFLDQPRPSILNSTAVEGGFALPEKYRQNRCFKVRELMPFLGYIIERCGWGRLESWLNNNGIPSSYIVNLDHQLNFRFLEALSIFLYEDGFKEEDAKLIGAKVSCPSMHGKLWESYARIADPLERIEEYVKQSPYYQCAFQYSVVDRQSSSLFVEVMPASFLKPILHEFDPYALIYLDEVREAALLEMGRLSDASQSLGKKGVELQLTELESIYRESERTLYELKVS
jgi:transcriptional regulator with XRE-family HTH domain